MTFNWLTSLPAGVTEADLIDLVDGVALDPRREAAMLAAMRTEPRLGLLVKQIREDRDAVGAFGEAGAPLGLAEGIEARLEADAIESLAAAASAGGGGDSIPISSVRIEEPGVWRLLTESAWGRRLATAASIAIVGGLMLFGGREAVRAWNKSGGATNLAGNTPGNAEKSVPVDDAGMKPAPMEIATNSSGTTDEGDTPTVAPDAGTNMTAVAANDSPAATEAITVAQAVALAREGRLAISVRATRDGAVALKRVELLAKTAGREGGWRALPMSGVPTEYAMLAMPTIVAPKAGGNGHVNPPDIAIAGSDAVKAPTAPVGAHGEPAVLPALHPVVKAIYTVELNPSEKSLASLVKSLTEEGGKNASPPEIVLRKLDQPIVRSVSFEPEDVLWWNGQSAAAWTRKATVPVVIETLE